jgi:hypothetical protein
MMMDMPEQPMMDMEEEQLKMMYPRIYGKIMPHVKYHCDRYEDSYGTMSCPSREHIENMSDDIYKKVEKDFDDEYSDDVDEGDERLDRQFGGGLFGRDLINILLLRELIGRRRRRRRRRRPRPY